MKTIFYFCSNYNWGNLHLPDFLVICEAFQILCRNPNTYIHKLAFFDSCEDVPRNPAAAEPEIISDACLNGVNFELFHTSGLTGAVNMERFKNP